MNERELAQAYAMLGLEPGCPVEALDRAFMKLNFSLIKGTGENLEAVAAQRARLKAAYELALADAKVREEAGRAAAAAGERASLGSPRPAPRAAATLLTPPVDAAQETDADGLSLFSFDSWLVNLVVPPLLLALTWAVTVSPLGFFLKGFHVWMHEFGHAVPAWLVGWRATPLPVGWTPVEQDHSNFVYFGVLFLLAVLAVAGWRERKIWPIIAAVGLAGLQAYLTWRLPEHRKEFWMVAGGVGGEFVLGTLFMMAWWVQLPDKFRWGGCRYLFFFIGATAFLNIWLRWRDVYRGIEEIPFGSMINGEEDAGGDMNRLMDDYGWTKTNLRQRFYFLGQWCWVALGVTWLVFALRLNRVADWVAGKFMRDE